MAKSMSISLSNDIYERLVVSSERMGLTKSGFITYALKQVFNSEDVLEKTPDLMEKMQEIINRLDERTEQ